MSFPRKRESIFLFLPLSPGLCGRIQYAPTFSVIPMEMGIHLSFFVSWLLWAQYIVPLPQLQYTKIFYVFVFRFLWADTRSAPTYYSVLLFLFSLGVCNTPLHSLSFPWKWESILIFYFCFCFCRGTMNCALPILNHRQARRLSYGFWARCIVPLQNYFIYFTYLV